MKKKSFLLLCLPFITSVLIQIRPIYASPSPSSTNSFSNEFSDLTFGLGLIDQYIGQMQVSRNGETNSMDYRLFLSSGLTYSFTPEWEIITEIGLLWPGGEDDQFTSKKSYFLNAYFGYHITDDFLFKLGGGLYMTSISGEGGVATLPNGEGSSNFYIPQGAATARNFTSNVGLNYFLTRDYSLSAEAIIFNLISSENRAYSYTLAIHYHLENFLWSN